MSGLLTFFFPLEKLEKLKKLRAERDAQEEQWEREKRRLELQSENWSYKEWLKEEKNFHIKQAFHRSEIRLKEGRPKPIDILHKNLQVDTQYAFDMRPPYEIFGGLSLAQLQELEEDINMYLELTPEEMNFWKALKLLCVEQIELISGKRKPVSVDVVSVFAGQNMAGLLELQGSIKEQLELGEDPEYWESLQHQCEVELARATLREIHAQRLQQRLSLMEESKRATERAMLEEQIRSRIKDAGGKPPMEVNNKVNDGADKDAVPIAPSSAVAPAQRSRPREKLVLDELVEEMEEEGSDEVMGDDERIRELEMQARELDQRTELLVGTGVEGDLLTEAEMLKVEMETANEENEELFAEEVEQGASTKPSWDGRYEPRKPKYYNRVRLGYEWNKYNSTHYNSDNPPPKVVHGYRFNVFYNDLIDPSRAPTYKLEPIPGNPDWAILRFRAGPPYLDVAFKVVNKPWEMSHKRGWKAMFDRGVLRLWFNFRRERYRR